MGAVVVSTRKTTWGKEACRRISAEQKRPNKCLPSAPNKITAGHPPPTMG